MIGALLPVVVAAAISLKGSLDSAAAEFAKASPGEAITVQGAASGVLVSQIEQGAPFDLFISASPAEMERLAVGKKLALGTRRALVTNALVVVVRKGLAPPEKLEGLSDPRFAKIAVGNPATVPAGRYAAQALNAARLLPGVKNRLVFGENVAQVLDYVIRGEVDAGLVYATDANHAGASVVPGPPAPASGHDPIVYEGGVIAGSKSAARARAFLEFLSGKTGQAIFARDGFGPPPTP